MTVGENKCFITSRYASILRHLSANEKWDGLQVGRLGGDGSRDGSVNLIMSYLEHI